MENEEIVEVNRYDASPLETKFDSTPEGFLTGTAIVTRVGVFPYLNKDGTMRFELRHPDDVFHADSLSTYLMKPITNGHPKVKTGLVDPNNYKDLTVGSTGSSTITNEKFLALPIVVHDAKAIEEVKNGKRELSCGYTCDLVPETGSWEGTAYTHRQKNIKVNHVSIVQRGRAGSVARIRLDGAEAPIDIEDVKENSMDEMFKTINLDSVDYKAEPKVIEALQDAQKVSEETKVKLDEAIAEKTKLEAERDSIKERFDALEAEITALKANHVDADKVSAMVKERVALEAFALKAGVEVKADMDDIAIKKAVVTKEAPTVNVEKLTDVAYLNARFDTVVEEFDAKQKAKEDATVRGVLAVKADGADKPAETYEEKYKKFRANLSAAHKTLGKGV
jgi:hypothetical protein